MRSLKPTRRDVVRMLSSVGFAEALQANSADDERRTAWYRAAKFGMFVHWGPYSLASVEASWPIMTPQPGTIKEADYVALAKKFNPVQFDPIALVRLARAA